jgi:hypothetical protein
MTSLRALILGPVLALGMGFAGLTATAAAQSAPTCVPASLNNSALQAGDVTISPLPGTRDADAETQISFLGAPASALSVQSVTGSRSGAHSGRLLAYSQGDGASFLPAHPFLPGEHVLVKARVRIGRVSHAIVDGFVIATPDPITTTPAPVYAGTSAEEQHFRSRSDLRPPTVTVTANSLAVAPGDIFLAPYAGPGQAGPMIIEPAGGLVWFKALAPGTAATDLRVQEYLGKPVLTWWQGDVSVHGFGLGEGIVADSAYAEIAHIRAGNGHQVDLHELQLTPQGTALITSYFPIMCKLSSVGGPSYGALTDSLMQEIDVRTGLVMYEWTSVDHVALGESYESFKSSSIADPWDFFHLNSINVDRDGSLLISARNTWTLYDLSPATGAINWRLGGKNSSFKGSTETRTAWQHDARELPDGTISLFDNGSSPRVHPQSRAIVLRLDPATGAVSLLTQLTHTPGLTVESEGNVQELGNGDWFLGWGQEPFFSELSPQGATLFDAHLPVHSRSYRSFRYPWVGVPEHPPAFAYESKGTGRGTVYASWNGATEVASWRLLAGASPHALHALLTAPRTGFETAIAVPAGTSGPYLAVEALGAGGNVLRSSTAASEPGL